MKLKKEKEIMKEFENIPFVSEDALICPKCRRIFPIGKFKGMDLSCPRGCESAVMSPIHFFKVEARKLLESALKSQRENFIREVEGLKHNDDTARAYGFRRIKWLDEGRNQTLEEVLEILK